MGKYKVDNAIILAAGFGSRFVPLTFEMPKGLIPVQGTPMIERQIHQLKERRIDDIKIVVGYLKEKFDYLIDKYDVSLIFNPDFNKKNNLSSLYYARQYLRNSYILSADNWMTQNIFNSTEDDSWYSCVYKDGSTSEWCVTVDENDRIKGVVVGGKDSWVMMGPVFVSESFSSRFKEKVEEYFMKSGTENYMWENVFVDEIEHFDMYINKQRGDIVYEFENLDELRVFDPEYGNDTSNVVLRLISDIFNVGEEDVLDIQCAKSGMTNKSFSFSIKGKPFVYRHPGEGSGKLINRIQEKNVYKATAHLGFTDESIYMDEKTGAKVSVFYLGAINTNARERKDLEDSMNVLRQVHNSGIKVEHSFNIRSEIEKYLSYCEEINAIRFSDYRETHDKMKELLSLSLLAGVNHVLCHVDHNPDNIIRLTDGSLRIIDWEYAGMGDPIMDIAMYSIYAYFSRKEALELLEIYLQRLPCKEEKIRLYAYMALGGYLWAMWTEYKQAHGVEFGYYGMDMYRYAKEYYKHCMAEKSELCEYS